MKKLNWIRWIWILFLTVQIVPAQERPDREIHYRYGDWISYPVMRFVTSIALGQQSIYFGTTGGISRYQFVKNLWDYPFTVSDGLENDAIRVVSYDFNTGILWCSTNAGLSYWISGVEEWRNISYESLGTGPVSSIGIGDQYTWIESSERIYQGDRYGIHFSNATIEEAIEDHVQWSGHLTNGDEKYLPDLFAEDGYLFRSDGYIIDSELRQFQIVETVQDEFNHLWLATWGLGGAAADVRTDYLTLLPYGLYSSDVRAMAWDGEKMWLGGHHLSEATGGITRWDVENDEWIYFEAEYLSQLRSDEVNAIAIDSSSVWFGTMDGLVRYDKKKDAWRSFSVYDALWDNRIYSIDLEDTVLWVGTELGINQISLPGMIVRQVRDERLIHRRIYQLEVDGHDVWAGTDRGIYRYTGEREEWVYVPGYPGMLVQNVTAISRFNHEVWFATDDGVQVFDKNNDQWIGFPADHFSIDRRINAIAADSTAVWVGTDNGVLKYNKAENRWRRFTTEDGLLDNSINWILLDGDYIWFGTNRGLTRFYWNAPYRND
ncbi:hypothetical protein MUP95_05325 [bacterium]|nr:hypothetical protein [bacterium]